MEFVNFIFICNDSFFLFLSYFFVVVALIMCKGKREGMREREIERDPKWGKQQQ